MQNQALEPLPFDKAPVLPRDKYTKAQDDAINRIRSLTPEPTLKEELKRTESEYPSWATGGMGLLLGFIAIGCFIISAGKQLTAANLVLSDFAQNSGGQVGSAWVLAGLVSFLGVSELGALAFSFAASMYSKPVLRLIAVVCAAMAIIANIVMTIIHPIASPDAVAHIFQWIETLFFPSLVLGVGYAGELALLKYFERRREAVKKLIEKRVQWEENTRNPMSHENYKVYFNQNILTELREICPPNRKRAFELALSNIPRYDSRLVSRERNRYDKIIALDESLPWEPAPNFTQPPSPVEAEDSLNGTFKHKSGTMNYSNEVSNSKSGPINFSKSRALDTIDPNEPWIVG